MFAWAQLLLVGALVAAAFGLAAASASVRGTILPFVKICVALPGDRPLFVVGFVGRALESPQRSKMVSLGRALALRPMPRMGLEISLNRLRAQLCASATFSEGTRNIRAVRLLHVNGVRRLRRRLLRACVELSRIHCVQLTAGGLNRGALVRYAAALSSASWLSSKFWFFNWTLDSTAPSNE